MRKREVGQALILVLILLAVGVLLVVPALRLTATSLKSSQIVLPRVKALYAADAAQEFILWKLLHDGLAEELMYSTDPNPSAHYDLDVCGAPVSVSVYMRATVGMGGMTLATEHVIKPTKTVSPDYVPDKDLYEYDYTIILDHLSSNTTVGLDAIYDLPPSGITGYVDDSSELSLDGGETWQDVPDPYDDELLSKGYLKWPADYEWDPVVTGAFSSDPGDAANYFYGMRDFAPRQVKMLRFKVKGRLDAGGVHCNWAVLKMEDGTNTLSGPQAPIAVGIENPGECSGGGGLEVTKSSYPEIIPPGVLTPITYTISVENMSGDTEEIQELIDYLPPGFDYIDGSVSENSTIITDEPLDIDSGNVNGVERQWLRWTEEQFQGIGQIKAGETKTLTFQATAIKDVSGSYYNEVIVILKKTATPGAAFAAAGVSPVEYGEGYSWNTGTVMVPAYDSSANASGVTINANMALILEGITITSWQVD